MSDEVQAQLDKILRLIDIECDVFSERRRQLILAREALTGTGHFTQVDQFAAHAYIRETGSEALLEAMQILAIKQEKEGGR